MTKSRHKDVDMSMHLVSYKNNKEANGSKVKKVGRESIRIQVQRGMWTRWCQILKAIARILAFTLPNFGNYEKVLSSRVT